MRGSSPIDVKATIWPAIRRAFIEREQKPTQVELAEEFRVNVNTLANIAAEEGWTLQRARFFDSQLVRSDVTQALVEIARDRRETSTAVANSALVGVRRITYFVEKIPDTTAPKAALDLLNTASFATANFAKSLKDAGLVEIPKALSDQLGKGDNSKDFLRGALQQINITVQAAQKGAAPSVVSEPIQAKQADEAPPP